MTIEERIGEAFEFDEQLTVPSREEREQCKHELAKVHRKGCGLCVL
jgi:hypothetical protein